MSTPRGKVLWNAPPERQAAAAITSFLRLARERSRRPLPDYDALWRWSVEDLGGFWQAVWDFCGVLHRGTIRSVLAEPSMPGARWFEGVELSFTENVLRHAGDRAAILFESEDEARRRVLTRDELRRQVAQAAAGLRRLGVRAGDRVAAFSPNIPETVIAMLAAAAVGAIWSSCSPDFGPQGVLDRFGQIAPRVLFSADGYVYAAKHHALGERIRALTAAIPSIEHVIVAPYCGPEVRGVPGLLSWSDFLASGGDAPLACERLPFAQPLAILYTSGTTGVPKCIVHGAGGTLLKHLEEHVLQVDLKADDVLFYFTTCGWMMWNWLLSALATGAAIVLYDGSPLHPDPARLFRLIDRCGITVFGTSPRFLASVASAGLEPRRACSLASLRTVLSTGSPLHASQYDWVYGAIKQDVHLTSISGGTDLIGCFVLGSPLHPVRAGEIACRALGMKVESWDEGGKPLVGEKGELVCTAPFPSMPVGFWNDPDGAKYRGAYFARFPGVWHHGDFIEIHADGASVIHGRSDATLNPGGVRIGTAELYRALAAVPEVADSLAVPREVPGDVRIALFVVLAPGAALDESLERKIKSAIRSACSPRHVPHEIHAIREVPRTVSGKSVELAVSRILRGEEVKNRDALANPEALDQFRRFSAPAAER